MPSPLQTRANHARFDPGFHFVLAPGLIILLAWAVVHLIYHRNSASGLFVLIGLLMFLMTLRMRQYSLKVQDRVIRLEERLRLSTLAGEPLRSRIAELTEPQLIALRFASDAELPVLALRAVDEHLSSKQIKEAIQNWRGDYFRV
jgi:hypothetical protein